MNRIYCKTMLVVLLSGASLSGYSQIITTAAGNGTLGFSGNGGQATAAELYSPTSVKADKSGNIYIADGIYNCIRKVNASGIIINIAGNEYGAPTTGGFSGDGGQATDAELWAPKDIAFDTAGNLYIADQLNHRIRKVDTAGVITTIAGNGKFGFYGDGGPATASELDAPQGVSLDALGNIYIADWGNNRIRIINTSGIINTFAGNGNQNFWGDGGQATDAELYLPTRAVADIYGNVYIADNMNNRVRVVDIAGIIKTFAGNGYGGYSGDGAQATDAELNSPTAITIDGMGNVYVSDFTNQSVRAVSNSGFINTIAGIDAAGYYGDGGQASDAELKYPEGISMDGLGNLYIADWGNNRIRKVSALSGINQLSIGCNYINIYPVPNSGIFTITGVSTGQEIELYNYLGQKVLSAISRQPTANFDISNMPNGIYFVRILKKDGSVVITKKIVKSE